MKNITDKLEKTGFKTASNRIKEFKNLKRKMTIAYERFRYVKPEKITAFNERLKKETQKEDKNAHYYNQLIFISIDQYEEAPPISVLEKIEEAQEIGCFDTFKIAKINSIKQVKDPIVFGIINGCPDKFFITQWDSDIAIEDILKENEG